LRRVAVVTDSTCDLPREVAVGREIAVVPLTVNIGGRSYLDGVEIEPASFYRLVRTAGDFPTTSQPPPGRFAEQYEALLRDHDSVVSVHISSLLSGTLDSAEQAAGMIGGGRVRVVDSRLVSMPLGLVALAADRGSGPDEVVAALEPVLRSATAYFTVASLESLRRGGRIGGAQALIGSVLQVKPILQIAEGEVTAVQRVRTYDRAVAKIVELARNIGGGGALCVIVGHADEPEGADRIARQLDHDCETLLIQPVGPVVGAHAGAGTVGIGVYPAAAFPLGLKTLVAAAT
jgi:DegV family protein with EDD domain